MVFDAAVAETSNLKIFKISLRIGLAIGGIITYTPGSVLIRDVFRNDETKLKMPVSHLYCAFVQHT